MLDPRDGLSGILDTLQEIVKICTLVASDQTF